MYGHNRLLSSLLLCLPCGFGGPVVSIISCNPAFHGPQHQTCPAPIAVSRSSVETVTGQTVAPVITEAKFLSFEEWKARNAVQKRKEAEAISASAANLSQTEVPSSRQTQTDKISQEDSKTNDLKHANTSNDSTKLENLSTSISGASAAREEDIGSEAKKERFNHASFDCAASIIQSNKESKGSSNILKANKDYYMLNTCAAASKFVIVEMCNDILVDTIQLANYEYFSGVFKTVKAQVAAKYPPGRDGWQEIGHFRARNARETQTFSIDNPLIWARYIKIEMTSFYGNEFYCPLSLLRVFGKTMMEDYKQEGSQELSESIESESALATASSPPVPTGMNEAAKSLAIFSERLSSILPESPEAVQEAVTVEVEIVSSASLPSLQEPNNPTTSTESISSPDPVESLSLCPSSSILPDHLTDDDSPSVSSLVSAATNETISNDSRTNGSPGSTTTSLNDTTEGATTTKDSSDSVFTVSSVTESDDILAEQGRKEKAPPPPSPSTQESIYKQMAKRISLLEANATLSLQYIESQSSLLVQSFAQLSTAHSDYLSHFLESVNHTVLQRTVQLKNEYETLYLDALRGVEATRREHNAEMKLFALRFSLLNDDVVFFKRLGIFQSLLLIILICFIVTTKQTGMDIQDHLRIALQGSQRDHSSRSDLARAMSPLSWRDRVRSVSMAASPYNSSSPYMFPVTQIERPQPNHPSNSPSTSSAIETKLRGEWTESTGLGLAVEQVQPHSSSKSQLSPVTESRSIDVDRPIAFPDQHPSISTVQSSRLHSEDGKHPLQRGSKDDMDPDLLHDIRQRLHRDEAWLAHARASSSGNSSSSQRMTASSRHQGRISGSFINHRSEYPTPEPESEGER